MTKEIDKEDRQIDKRDRQIDKRDRQIDKRDRHIDRLAHQAKKHMERERAKKIKIKHIIVIYVWNSVPFKLVNGLFDGVKMHHREIILAEKYFFYI